MDTGVWKADAQEKEDSVKSPDYIERLARKYMQKCTVESSTESESESRAEVVPSPLAGRPKKAKESRGLQFLDPYDGDSEDASVHTDCGIKYAPWTNSASKAMPLEDADTSEDEESFHNPPNVGEIQAVNGCSADLELAGLQRDPSQPPATEAFIPTGLTPDHALLMAVNPSVPAELPAIQADTAPQPLLTARWDGSMAQQPVIKRKQGTPVPEAASEKLKRKKFRAT
ncbi:PREDICTED: uncharacterized protein LOC101820411 [Ficedula albicollis]|uniref:uncharacterized protein LOC101820411 n=1 Tax=Ficedula albicollis TaxID=59894 RepID=UPI0003595444|nr:PREDICTED: uncharacterized protein LOC101820411 [Ficedula albicollis]